MAGARTRLAILVVGLVALWVVFGPIGGVLSKDDVRGAIDAAGSLAPLAFVPIAACWRWSWSPARSSRRRAARCSGRGSASSRRSAARSRRRRSRCSSAATRAETARASSAVGAWSRSKPWLDRQGVATIVIARLIPGLSDAAVSYAAGAVGVSLWQILVGTAIGAAPRALAYAALGDSITDLTSPQGIAAAALLVATAVVGGELLRRTVSRSRAAAAVAEQDR